MTSLAQRLQAVFRQQLELSHEDPTELHYAQHPNWDSIAHLKLVAAIEAEFEILFETEDVLAMSGFAEAMAILERHNVR